MYKVSLKYLNGYQVIERTRWDVQTDRQMDARGKNMSPDPSRGGGGGGGGGITTDL